MPAPRSCRPLLAIALLALCACGSMAPPTQARDASLSGTAGIGQPRDAAAAGPPGPAGGEPAVQTFSLRPGGHVAPGGGHLRYLRLVNDSRCAPDVQCIWAGDAEIALSWTPDGGTARTFSLHTGIEPRQQPLGDGRHLRLVELARGPAPVARLELRAAP